MSSRVKIYLSGCLAGALLLVGCRGCTEKKPTRTQQMTEDVATRGFIYVAADESYRYILEEEKYMFEQIYPNAEIHILYCDEKTAFEKALNDSVRLVVVSTAEHNAMNTYLHDRNIVKRVTPVGRDAVAVIANKALPLKRITANQLRDLVSGKKVYLNEINPAWPHKKINVYYDSDRSGIARFLAEKWLQGSGTLTGKASDSTGRLLQQVREDEWALGLIGFNYVSDKDDARTRALISSVNVLAMSREDDTTEYFLPSQSTIADSTYPLIRRMLIVNKEGKAGLGTGFASFIAGPKGQKILLKAGMVPQHIPERNIEIVHK